MEQETFDLIAEPQSWQKLKRKWNGLFDAAVRTECTQENINETKKYLSEIRREFRDVDAARKKVKEKLLQPYREFETEYENSVTTYYKAIEDTLSHRIKAVENEILSEYEMELRVYFSELCTAHGLDWLTFSETGVKATMTEAKKKNHKKDKELLRSYVARIGSEVETILALGEQSAEVLAQYKRQTQSRNFEDAIRTVFEFRAAAEKEKTAIASQNQNDIEQENTFRVQRIIKEKTVDKQAAEEIIECVFTVQAPVSKIKKLKIFMEGEGIKYE